MLCWHAAQQQAPSPRARARVELWRVETPTPEALICPNEIAGFGIAHAGHPSSHALPPGRGTN